jgi:hypothetical protein
LLVYFHDKELLNTRCSSDFSAQREDAVVTPGVVVPAVVVVVIVAGVVVVQFWVSFLSYRQVNLLKDINPLCGAHVFFL